MTSPKTVGPLAPLAIRSSVGGLLMGFANLVPGISGGTMLLATGIYTQFIQAVAEITTFRFRLRSMVLLGIVGAAALTAILSLAGPVKYLVGEYRWVMYSLFIGLTFGGVPLVWREARPATPAVFTGALIGFAAMAIMAFTQGSGHREGGYLILTFAGIAGASAMILPGVSGAYLLLVLGQYERILGAIDQFQEGLGDDHHLILEALHVIVPVGLGVAVGIAGISNLVRWTLERYKKATLGVLLGLLFGAVLGIWPFQMEVETGEALEYFTPGWLQVLAALGLVAAGFGITVIVDRLGRAAGEKTTEVRNGAVPS